MLGKSKAYLVQLVFLLNITAITSVANAADEDASAPKEPSEIVTPFIRDWADEISKISGSQAAGKQLAKEHTEDMVRADAARLARLQKSYNTQRRICQGAGAVIGFCAGLGAQYALGFQFGTDNLESVMAYMGLPAGGLWAAGRAHRSVFGSGAVLTPNAAGEDVLKRYEDQIADLTKAVGSKIRELKELQSKGVWTIENLQMVSRSLKSLELLSMQSLYRWSDAQIEMNSALENSPDLDRYLKRIHTRVSNFSNDLDGVRLQALKALTDEVSERFKIDLPRVRAELAAANQRRCAKAVERISESSTDLHGPHLDD